MTRKDESIKLNFRHSTARAASGLGKNKTAPTIVVMAVMPAALRFAGDTPASTEPDQRLFNRASGCCPSPNPSMSRNRCGMVGMSRAYTDLHEHAKKFMQCWRGGKLRRHCAKFRRRVPLLMRSTRSFHPFPLRQRRNAGN